MRTMFGTTATYAFTSKASSCQNASFNHAQVMSLSTILVVLILMFVINIIIPIIICSGLIILVMLQRKFESKPKLILNS